jgi:2-oxo-4-hydroxy-4-carboxy-5-ureidoimidazoline decarboxylase
MSRLAEWNQLPEPAATVPLLACCGSKAFATQLVARRPFLNLDDLLESADALWWSLDAKDWLEAFGCHPRIGESATNGAAQHRTWSTEEQSGTKYAHDSVLQSILIKNREYEARHGFIYIVCASGKTADELLAILDRRLSNSTEIELQEAAEQQRQITHIRLRKWLAT